MKKLLNKGTILSSIIFIGGLILDAMSEKKLHDEMQTMVQEEVAKQLSNSENNEEES